MRERERERRFCERCCCIVSVLIMSSGFGSHGGTGRCHSFMVDYQACLEKSESPQKECLGLRDDYFECLHHKKEYQRRNIIIDKYRKDGMPAPAPAPEAETKA